MRATLVIVVLALQLGPAAAQAGGSIASICSVISDRAVELYRAGEIARASQLKPQLEQCIRLMKAEQLEAAKQLVRQYDDTVVKASAPRP